MPSCAVKSCRNYSQKIVKSQGITYHRFPQDQIRHDWWVQIIRQCRKDNDWKPSTSTTVCSVHFEDTDFKITSKGLRCLLPTAIPKKLLSDDPEFEAQITYSMPTTSQASSDVREEEADQPPSSSGNTTQYCRLCAVSDCDGKLISVQNDDDLEKLVEKMLKRLNSNVDFNVENLPKTICSACVKALYTAYDFVVGIDLAQTTLNNIAKQRHSDHLQQNEDMDISPDLSRTSLLQVSSPKIERLQRKEHSLSSVPRTDSVKVETVIIEIEASDFEEPSSPVSSTTDFPTQKSPNIERATSKNQTPSDVPYPTFPVIQQLKFQLEKKKKLLERKNTNVKTLNQKIRRLQKRNESLTSIVKNLKGRILK